MRAETYSSQFPLAVLHCSIDSSIAGL
jgi:hypothetical protein